MNYIAFDGRLTKEPELQTSTNGVEFCKFTVAVDRKKTKKDDETLVDLSERQMREKVGDALDIGERQIDRHLKAKTLKMHEEGKTDNDIAKELYLEDKTVQRYLKESTDKAA